MKLSDQFSKLGLSRLRRGAWRACVAAAGLVVTPLAAPASAEVTSSDENGFSIRLERTTSATPEAAFELFATPAQWWSDTHTWSGDADSMSINRRESGGCWCELLPAFGSVEHGHIIRWDPEHGRIVFRAELGPLQSLPVNGKLEWIVTAAPDGTTRVAMRYEVAGRGMADPVALSEAVNRVLAEQLDRFVRQAELPVAPATTP